MQTRLSRFDTCNATGRFRLAKIINCTRPASETKCWYRNMIGHIIMVKQSGSTKNLMLCPYKKGSVGKINESDLSFSRKDTDVQAYYSFIKGIKNGVDVGYNIDDGIQMISSANMKFRFPSNMLWTNVLGKNAEYVSLSEFHKQFPKYKDMTYREILKSIFYDNSKA